MAAHRAPRFWTLGEKRLVHVMEEDFTFSSFGASQILTIMLLGEIPRARRARTRAVNEDATVTEDDFRALKGDYERQKDELGTEWADIIAELDSPEHQQERDALKAAIITTAETHEIDNYLDWGRPTQPSRTTTHRNTSTDDHAIRSMAPTPSPKAVKREEPLTASSNMPPPPTFLRDNHAPLQVVSSASATITANDAPPDLQPSARSDQVTQVPLGHRTNWQAAPSPNAVRLQARRGIHNFAEQIVGPESSSNYVVDRRAGNLRPVFICIAGQWVLQHTTSQLHRRNHSM